MVFELDLHDGLDGLPDAFRIDDRRIALDEARGLERADAARAGRGRQADAFREISDADASVALQDVEDAPIRLV